MQLKECRLIRQVTAIFMDSQGYQLIEVVGSPSQAQVSFLFKSRFTPPDLIVNLMHGFVKQLAVIWQQSREDV